MILVLLTVSIVLHIVSCTVYYVSAPNGTDCPHNTICNNLSYYLDNELMTSNTVLIFLNGTHILDREEPAVINGVTNLTLKGEGIMEDGSYWTVRQSTVVIKCRHYKVGLFIVDWSNVHISSITFDGCGVPIQGQLKTHIMSNYNSSFPYNWEFAVGLNASHTLMFLNGSGLSLNYVTIQYGTGYGLTIVNSYSVNITNSYFFKNNIANKGGQCFFDSFCRGGNIRIVHILSTGCPFFEEESSVLAIRHTYVSYGVNDGGVPDLPSQYFATYDYLYFPFGGGIGLIPTDYSCNKFRFELDSVTMYNNYAYFSGSNIGLLGLPVPLTILHSHSLSGWTNTRAVGFGAGILINVFETLPSNVQSELNIINSTFSDNFGFYGSGLYLMTYRERSWNSITIDSCTFNNNKGYQGASILIERRNFVNPSSLTINMKDVTVTNTLRKNVTDLTARFKFGGAVTLINIVCNVSGLHIVDNTKSTGLVMYLTKMYLHGENIIRNNSNFEGGGAILYAGSYFVLQPPCKLSFIGNHADTFGGGIYIPPEASLQNQSSPCFFQIEDPSHLFPSNIEIYVEDNTADITGSFLSGGRLVDCLLVTNFAHSYCYNYNYNYSDLFNCSLDILKSIIYPYPVNDPYFISSEAVAVVFCNGSELYYSKTRDYVYTMPGKAFNVSLVTAGETFGISPGTIEGSVRNGNIVMRQFMFKTGNYCANYTFAVKSYGSNQVEIFLQTTLTVVYFPASINPRRIIVHFEECSPGFDLSSTNNDGSYICDCNNYIKGLDPNIRCDVNTSTITTPPQREQTYWIGYNNDNNCTYIGNNCPFDYCVSSNVTFNIFHSDVQCELNRSGILCGECSEGLSLMLGSNKCGKCSNNGIALLLLFGVAGLALVVLLIGLNLTVSVGTINGLIFYVNVVKMNEPIFFPNGPTPFLSQFISWLNLDFGFETCFSNNLTSLVKVFLQFVFPIYIWLIILTTIGISRCVTRFPKIAPYVLKLVSNNGVQVFATLLLLSYTKLIRTLVLVFADATVNCDGIPSSRWRFDGNIEYAQKGHLALFVFTLLFAVFVILPYTLFLVGLPIVVKVFSRCGSLWLGFFKPLCDAYSGPHKDSCRFWAGLLIVIRILIAAVVSATQNNIIVLYVILFSAIVLITLALDIDGPYEKQPLNILESFFLANLLGLSILTLGGHASIGIIISTTLALLAFVIIICYHIFVRFKPVIAKSKYTPLRSLANGRYELPLSNERQINEGSVERPLVVSDPKTATSSSVVLRKAQYAGNTSSNKTSPNNSTIVGNENLHQAHYHQYRDSALEVAEHDEYK